MTNTNDAGQYAWGESYLMLAYVTMYEASDDTRYLDEFVEHANAVVDRTDEARRVRDYRGKSLPAWRCGGIYTIGALNLKGRGGRPVIKVLGTYWHSNSATTISVFRGSTWRTFGIMVRNPSGRDEVYRNLSVDARSPNYFARRVNGVSSFIRLRGLVRGARGGFDNPSSLRSTHLVPLNYIFGAHTGLIAYPLARFARIVEVQPGLKARYGTEAGRYLVAARRALAVHEDEWTDARSYGYYKFRRGAPVWADGVELPFNQNLAMGRLILELYRATREQAYKVRAAKLAALFKRNLALDQNGAFLWNYWWGRGVRGWVPKNSPSLYTLSFAGGARSEDLPHAALDVDFVHEAAAEATGMPFSQANLVTFANTFHANMTGSSGKLSLYVNGNGVVPSSELGGSGGWLGLSHRSRNVYLTTGDALAQAMLQPGLQPDVVYGVAYSILEGRLLGSEPMLAPSVAATNPPRYVRGLLTTAVEATADATPSVSFFVDRFNGGMLGAPPFTRTWDTRLLADGAHVFRAVARDADGRSRAAKAYVVVDNTAPRGAVVPSRAVVMSPNSDGYAETAPLILFASESVKADVRLKHGWTGAVISPPHGSFSFGPGRRTWRWDGRSSAGTLTREGPYAVHVANSDRAGNRGRTLVARIVVNNTLYRVVAPDVFRRSRPVPVSYTLRRQAWVSWWVVSGRGVLIARSTRQTLLAPGRRLLRWNQRDRSGRIVAPGGYRLVLRARNNYGTVDVTSRIRII